MFLQSTLTFYKLSLTYLYDLTQEEEQRTLAIYDPWDTQDCETERRRRLICTDTHTGHWDVR
jgi:hypothetical protein